MFLKVLDSLMAERGLNKNSLSKQSGIPYTTIDGFYKKGYANAKLTTLRQLSAFFNVSLDYLVDEKSDCRQELSIDEKKIIEHYRQLNRINRQKTKEYIRLLLLDENSKKQISTHETLTSNHAEIASCNIDDVPNNNCDNSVEQDIISEIQHDVKNFTINTK